MSYEVGKLGFPIHVKSENENSMTIYELIRFNLFLVSGILYFPVWSYVETMPCGDSHHRFPINTKKQIVSDQPLIIHVQLGFNQTYSF